jgi:hypothetical protein
MAIKQMFSKWNNRRDKVRCTAEDTVNEMNWKVGSNWRWNKTNTGYQMRFGFSNIVLFGIRIMFQLMWHVNLEIYLKSKSINIYWREICYF